MLGNWSVPLGDLIGELRGNFCWFRITIHGSKTTLIWSAWRCVKFDTIVRFSGV